MFFFFFFFLLGLTIKVSRLHLGAVLLPLALFMSREWWAGKLRQALGRRDWDCRVFLGGFGTCGDVIEGCSCGHLKVPALGSQTKLIFGSEEKPLLVVCVRAGCSKAARKEETPQILVLRSIWSRAYILLPPSFSHPVPPSLTLVPPLPASCARLPCAQFCAVGGGRSGFGDRRDKMLWGLPGALQALAVLGLMGGLPTVLSECLSWGSWLICDPFLALNRVRDCCGARRQKVQQRWDLSPLKR